MIERIEFGLPRTACACEVCINNCRHMPGFLLPSDLERLLPAGRPLAWAADNLLASPGALVSRGGVPFRIPTIVPAVTPAGACINLTADNRCAIWESAPFGCAFFDCGPERNGISKDGLLAVAQVWYHGGQYADIWEFLWGINKRQLPPEILRARFDRPQGVRP